LISLAALFCPFFQSKNGEQMIKPFVHLTRFDWRPWRRVGERLSRSWFDNLTTNGLTSNSHVIGWKPFSYLLIS